MASAGNVRIVYETTDNDITTHNMEGEEPAVFSDVSPHLAEGKAEPERAPNYRVIHAKNRVIPAKKSEQKVVFRGGKVEVMPVPMRGGAYFDVFTKNGKPSDEPVYCDDVLTEDGLNAQKKTSSFILDAVKDGERISKDYSKDLAFLPKYMDGTLKMYFMGSYYSNKMRELEGIRRELSNSLDQLVNDPEKDGLCDEITELLARKVKVEKIDVPAIKSGLFMEDQKVAEAVCTILGYNLSHDPSKIMNEDMTISLLRESIKQKIRVSSLSDEMQDEMARRAAESDYEDVPEPDNFHLLYNITKMKESKTEYFLDMMDRLEAEKEGASTEEKAELENKIALIGKDMRCMTDYADSRIAELSVCDESKQITALKGSKNFRIEEEDRGMRPKYYEVIDAISAIPDAFPRDNILKVFEEKGHHFKGVFDLWGATVPMEDLPGSIDKTIDDYCDMIFYAGKEKPRNMCEYIEKEKRIADAEDSIAALKKVKKGLARLPESDERKCLPSYAAYLASKYFERHADERSVKGFSEFIDAQKRKFAQERGLTDNYVIDVEIEVTRPKGSVTAGDKSVDYGVERAVCRFVARRVEKKGLLHNIRRRMMGEDRYRYETLREDVKRRAAELRTEQDRMLDGVSFMPDDHISQEEADGWGRRDNMINDMEELAEFEYGDYDDDYDRLCFTEDMRDLLEESDKAKTEVEVPREFNTLVNGIMLKYRTEADL